MVYDTLFGLGRSMSSVAESVVDSEIEKITLESVEECAGDPFEFATAMMYESEMAMQNLDMAVMCCEYAYLKENGTEMVYEAGVMKKFFEGAKAVVKKWWENIVKFFKKVLSYVDQWISSDKSFVKRHEKDAVEAGTVTGLNFKGYNYDIKKPAAMMATIKNEFSTIKNSNIMNVSKYNAEDDSTEILDDIRGKICGSSKVAADEFVEKLLEVIKGSKEKTEITSWDCKAGIQLIKDAKHTKAALDAAFGEAKAIAKTAETAMKTLEDRIKDMDKDTGMMGNASKGAHNAVQIIKAILNIASIVNNQGAKAITAANRQSRAFTAKAIAKYKSGAGDDDTVVDHNSTVYESVFAAFGI